MERIMRSQAMGDSRAMDYMKGRKIMEINPNHDIIQVYPHTQSCVRGAWRMPWWCPSCVCVHADGCVAHERVVHPDRRIGCGERRLGMEGCRRRSTQSHAQGL